LRWPDLRAPDEPRPLLRRIGWMALIWAGSVAVLGAVAFIIRQWIVP
jgi:hypothetical protein